MLATRTRLRARRLAPLLVLRACATRMQTAMCCKRWDGVVGRRRHQERQHRRAASRQCSGTTCQSSNAASGQTESSNPPHRISNACGRRQCLTAGLSAAAAAAAPAAAPALAAVTPEAAAARVQELQAAARQAYAGRDFAAAVQALNGIIQLQPEVGQWREMRAQVRAGAGGLPLRLSWHSVQAWLHCRPHYY